MNSEKLGPGGAALASGTEVLAYYEQVIAKLLRSGRLDFYPMCESVGEGRFHSLVEAGREYRVHVRKKTVDATYMNVQVPSIRSPRYEVSPEAQLVPPNALPRISKPPSAYVVIGAGKTGIDAVLFLLDRGVTPDLISWVMPNDAWLLDRALIQPNRPFHSGMGGQLESFGAADSLDGLMTALEERDLILRLDREVWPTKYRCATVSREELERLRLVKNVIRKGRVGRIDPTEIVLEEGTIPTQESVLHVDCTADGLARRPSRPLFEGDRITLQSLFMCQQVFSASVAAYVETRFESDAEKNELCEPVPHPEFTRDFVLCMATTMKNMGAWGKKFGWWLRASRLCTAHHDSLLRLIANGIRSRRRLGDAGAGMMRLLEQEFPDLMSGQAPSA